jgi:CHAD domain-containing protein
VSTHHEVERAYAVGPDDVLPDLSVLFGVASATEPRTARLVATYVDTEDLSLIRAGVTLRRRSGGDDEGWHLKIPAGGGRDEVHRPLGRDDVVPTALERMVVGWTRGLPLAPVATIETERTTHLLKDGEGTVLAEVADDTVIGTPSEGEVSRWREVEIELVSAGPDLLDRADDLLAAASNIHPRVEQRKIGTVLADRLATFAPRPDPDPDGPAGPVLHARLLDQVTQLQARDCDVRRGVDDAVHQVRVACRRLRGALATYRPLVERDITDTVRDELGWLAQSLGDGRDAEVVRDRLLALVDELPEDLVTGPVRRRLESHYAARMAEADRAAQEVLDSPRYLRLLGHLDALVTDPPWTDLADKSADKVLRRLVVRDWKRLRDQVDVAHKTDDEEALHDVRKAAKRLRYACEVLEPGWGKHAKGLRKAAQEITRVLGDHQDAAVGAEHLLRVAEEATAAGESAFTYGVLHARDEVRARQLEADFDAVWGEAAKSRLRAWLD